MVCLTSSALALCKSIERPDSKEEKEYTWKSLRPTFMHEKLVSLHTKGKELRENNDNAFSASIRLEFSSPSWSCPSWSPWPPPVDLAADTEADLAADTEADLAVDTEADLAVVDSEDLEAMEAEDLEVISFEIGWI